MKARSTSMTLGAGLAVALTVALSFAAATAGGRSHLHTNQMGATDRLADRIPGASSPTIKGDGRIGVGAGLCESYLERQSAPVRR